MNRYKISTIILSVLVFFLIIGILNQIVNYNELKGKSNKCDSQVIVPENEGYRYPKDIPYTPNIPGLSFSSDGKTIGVSYDGKFLFFSQSGMTDSMAPSSAPASTSILTTRFDAESLKVGQVVGYLYPGYSFGNHGTALVHRIVAINKTNDGFCYVMQGDNVPTPDSCIKPSEVKALEIGIIFGTIKGKGYDNSAWADKEPYKSTPENYQLCSSVECKL